MGYEQRFEAFTRASEATDFNAAIRAAAWLNECRSRELAFPDRPIVLGTVDQNGIVSPGVVTLQGLNRSKLKGGGSTVFKNGRFIVSGCYDTEAELQLLLTGPIDAPAITIETAQGQPTGQNKWKHVRVEGPYPRAVHFADPGGVGNNDFNEWENLTTYGVAEESVLIDSAMAVGHEFKNCYFSGGKYGIRSRGAFNWRGGRMSGSTVSNFAQWTVNSVAGAIHIEGLNSENSARLFINYSPTEAGNGTIPGTTQTAGIPVTIDGGTRFALDYAVIDGSDNLQGTDFQLGVLPTGDRIGVAVPVNCGFRGPYLIQGCHFSNGLHPGHMNGVSRVRFRLAGGGQSPDKGGIVRACTVATNNINAPLLDRGRAENNLAYLVGSGTFEWFPDHAP